ncbi:SCO family protein [Streptomyces sp. TRM72054]|uniref:SCO family protein n=1 Tax=Streptomyces sp. TRM72054 TaxID=2870562 RepID=UPI001C8B1695|nr:SCO family protein [Streptomyces sp. TRM72054]MBX9395762.1 SCO family protein [Streptomyces sp. TRM72054]
MRKPTVLAATLTAVAALTLSACGSGAGAESKDTPLVSTDATAPAVRRVLDQPFTKPDLVLTDTHGKAFDLRKETEGRLTYLYFGYTHCPDACPLTMSNLGLAYKDLPKADQDKVRVVFVTTDPERDTPKELGKWLPSAGHADFVGLSGDFATVQAAARSVAVGMEPATKDAKGKVTATHGKTVLAFSPKDDKGHVLYHGGEATAEDYAKDLPKLLKGQRP